MSSKGNRRMRRCLGRALTQIFRIERYNYDAPDQFSKARRKRLALADAVSVLVARIDVFMRKRDKTERFYLRFSSRSYLWGIRSGTRSRKFGLTHPTARHRKYLPPVQDDEFASIPF